MLEPALEDALRAFAGGRRYHAATIERWLALDPADAQALLVLAQQLRLGENQLRDLWDWAEEIAQRDRTAVAQVLSSEPLAAARQAHKVGRNDRLKLTKAALRRLRFPQLSATEDRLAGLARRLELPRNVRISFPDFLEGEEVRVEITATSPAALRAAAERLRAAADSTICDEIFAVLGEAP